MGFKSTSPHWAEIGGVRSYVVPGKGAHCPCVVLFHGFGADASDLVPLAGALQLKKSATWVFPDGCQEVLIGPGMSGRAWFPIDMAALEKAMRTGTYRDMSEMRPSGLDQAVELGSNLLSELRDLSPGRILWGGFSQGAMLSLELAITEEVLPEALILLSGTILDEKNLRSKMGRLSGVPCFQSHGSKDALLSPVIAEKLAALLKEAGMVSEFHMFDGGHEIPVNVLRQLSQFLNRCI